MKRYSLLGGVILLVLGVLSLLLAIPARQNDPQAFRNCLAAGIPLTLAGVGLLLLSRKLHEPLPAKELADKQTLIKIAKGQKGVLTLIAVVLLINVGISLAAKSADREVANSPQFTIAVAIVLVLASLVAGIYTYRLAAAVGAGLPWLWTLLASLLCVGVLPMALLSARATRVLKSSGLKVGLLGISDDDIKQLGNPAAQITQRAKAFECPECGHQITVSWVDGDVKRCASCGKTVRIPDVPISIPSNVA
jgi:hypothetical protein